MENRPKQLDIKRIAGTLKYGGFDNSRRAIAYTACIIPMLLFVAGGVGLCVGVVVPFIRENGGMYAVGAAMLIVAVVLLIIGLPLLFGFFLHSYEERRKEIKLWLEDAIELKAYAREIGRTYSYPGLPLKSAVKIRVEFKLNGKEYKRESRGRQIGSESVDEGIHSEWLKYANRKIDILYSPKYDEVIVLKPQTKTV